MKRRNLKRLVGLALWAAVALILSACGAAPQQAAAPQYLNPTVVIVQYVTQVVMTVTPEPPTPTPPPPTPLPIKIGFDPLAVQIYYPITMCPIASRLHVGDKAFVANMRGGILGLHYSRDVNFSPMFRRLQPGEILNIIDGPYCEANALVWEVVASDGTTGFVAEGDGEIYWLLPLGEKVDNKLLKPTPIPRVQFMIKKPRYCTPR